MFRNFPAKKLCNGESVVVADLEDLIHQADFGIVLLELSSDNALENLLGLVLELLIGCNLCAEDLKLLLLVILGDISIAEIHRGSCADMHCCVECECLDAVSQGTSTG